jgi:hypothetical protein
MLAMHARRYTAYKAITLACALVPGGVHVADTCTTDTEVLP